MIPLLLLAGLALLAAPGLVRGSRGDPVFLARLVLVVQLIGFVLVEAGLLLWATPALLDLVGASDLARLCRRMLGGLVPGSWESGVAAGVGAVGLAVAAAGGVFRAVAVQRSLRVESCVGEHRLHDDHELVVVPTSAVLAYTAGGRPPQVVMSRGLMTAVGPDGIEAVRAHEAVHARHRHDRYLLAVAGIRSAFAWFPPARRGALMVRLALERWADEEAGEFTSGGREGVRRALLATAFWFVAPEVAGFGSADTLAIRVRALAAPPPRTSLAWVWAGYLAVWLAAVGAAGSLGWAARMSILAVTSPGLCIVG